MRWCNWARAGSPSRTRARRWSSCTRASAPRARTAGHPSGSTFGRSTAYSRRFSRQAFTTRPSCGQQSWWRRVYERIIRRAAGLGRAPREPDPDRYEHMHAHCDVLVVGAGPAGLMAALAAGRSGARVILADEQPELGGALLRGTESIIRLPSGCAPSRPSSRPARSCACSRAPPPSAITTTTTWACSSACAIICRRPPPRICPASACARSGRGRSCWLRARSSARWCSRRTTGRASCWRARCAPISTAMR